MNDRSEQAISANASSSQIARNALAGYLSTAVGMLSGLVVTPLLVRRLGPDQFGLWVLLGSIMSYIGLVETGIGSATTKRIAECLATNDRNRLERVLSTALVMYTGIALIALAVACVLLVSLGRIFHIPPQAVATGRMCFLLLAINQALSFVFTIQSVIFIGTGRLSLMTGYSICTSLGLAITQVVLVLTGHGIVALAVSVAVFSVISAVISRQVIRREMPVMRVRVRSADWSMACELLRYGSRNAVTYLCATIAYGADTAIIGILLPVANVSHYAIASKLVGCARNIAIKPIDVLTPAYAHAHALADKSRLFRLFTKSTNISMALALPFAVVFCALGDRIIRLWVGEGHQASFRILVVLALTMVFQLQGHAAVVILTATEQNRRLVHSFLVQTPLNLVLSIVLTMRLGPVGVALGSLISVLLVDTCVLPAMVCRAIGADYGRYVRRAFGSLVVPTLATMAIGAFGRASAMNAATVICFAAGMLGVYWALWLGVCVGAEERAIWFGRLRSAAFGH